VANRRYFYIQAEQIFKRTRQPLDALAVLMLDIDHFKQVNDSFGHIAGDAILRQVAGRLSKSMRPTDVLARYGGEEFIILLPRTAIREAEQIAQRIWQAVSEMPFSFENTLIRVTVSIGVAGLSKDIQDLDTITRCADEALYQAKQAGRNQCKTWNNTDK
jgi:diguanylate cyclase (GGDEF)-like protein